MKKSKEVTAETRKRIVEAATQRFCCSGINGAGLADVMAEAGLTHGGFYRHFESKDQLVAEACIAGLDCLIGSSEEATQSCGVEDAFRAIVENYLAPAHRENRAGGCPLAGLGSELARAEGQTRMAAIEGFERFVDEIVKHLPNLSPEAARAEAVYAASAMVGALTMSRLVEGSALSDTILSETCKRLTEI